MGDHLQYIQTKRNLETQSLANNYEKRDEYYLTAQQQLNILKIIGMDNYVKEICPKRKKDYGYPISIRNFIRQTIIQKIHTYSY